MILAAGEGTRLRPLTEHCPKPMLPVGGRPLLEYLLKLLRSHGVREVAINLHHHPEAVSGKFGDGSGLGMKIVYSHERELLGTAGALKRMASFLDDTFFVLCGDLLTDADVTSLAEFHRWRCAVATTALHRVEEPGRVGLVDAAADGRILRFEEKPPRGRRFTNLACAGIYVFEPSALAEIPEDRPSDLGHDLIPCLIDRGLPVYGLEGVGQVLDVGSPERYALAQVMLPSLALNGRNGRKGAVIPFRGREGAPSTATVPNAGHGQNGAGSVIDDFLAEARAVLEHVEPSDVETAVFLLVTAHRRERSVFAVGNGGSAATASHLASDLARSTQQNGGPPLRAFSLSDNVPQLTAWANDACYEESFAAQLQAYARPGDVLVAVSASGNSPNILAAAKQARNMGLAVIALTGFGGGRLRGLADAALVIDSYDYGQVEGAHMVLVHLLSKMVVRAAVQQSQEAEAPAAPIDRALPTGMPAEVLSAMEAAG
jgi:NDP-sugar pyrophosphorylase family protein/phosphoheptose isomerase